MSGKIDLYAKAWFGGLLGGVVGCGLFILLCVLVKPLGSYFGELAFLISMYPGLLGGFVGAGLTGFHIAKKYGPAFARQFRTYYLIWGSFTGVLCIGLAFIFSPFAMVVIFVPAGVVLCAWPKTSPALPSAKPPATHF